MCNCDCQNISKKISLKDQNIVQEFPVTSDKQSFLQNRMVLFSKTQFFKTLKLNVIAASFLQKLPNYKLYTHVFSTVFLMTSHTIIFLENVLKHNLNQNRVSWCYNIFILHILQIVPFLK